MLVIKVNVEGNRELASKFAKFRAYMQAGLIPAWVQIAASLHGKIIAATPKRTGQLVSSTTPSVMPMRVRSVASAINPKDGYNYARIQHDGGTAFWMGNRRKPVRITGKNYMTGPLWATAPEVPEILSAEIARIIALCGLG